MDKDDEATAMTTPGGAGPIETAYVEIKPKVDPKFADDLRKQILPMIKKISKEADAAFQNLGSSTKTASSSISGLSRSLSGASKSAANFAKNAHDAANASNAIKNSSAGAIRGLNGMDDSARRAARGVNEARTQWNFLARALIVGGVYAAITALKDLGKFGFGAAAQLEQTKIAFDGLFGDTRLSDAFVKRLQDFAAKTPFEFQGLAEASQRLIAIGMNGDQAVDTLTIVGNAAAAVGADQSSINRVITALAQIQAKGKLSAEEINQIGEALPNLDRSKVVENLAKTFGKTTQQIQDLQQKGMIPADAGLQALLTTLQQVPGAMGAMDRQSQTLIGKFSTFKDTIKQNFSNSLVDSLPIVGDALLQLTNTVSTQLDTLGPAMGDALVGILPLVEGFVNLVGPLLTDLMNTIVPLLNQFAPALAPIGEAISTVLGALGPALEPLAAALGQLAMAMAPVAGELGVAFANALISVTPLLLMFANNMIALMNFLMSHQQLLGDMTALFITFFAAFKAYKIIGSAVEALKALGVVTFAQTLLQQGLNAALRANPIGAVITVVAALATGFVLLYRHSETFRNGVQKLKEFVVPAIKFIVDAFIEWATLLVTLASKAFGWVPGLGPKLKAAEKGVDDFKNAVNKSIDSITKRVDITVVYTYTTADKKEAERLDKRQQRINKAMREAAPGGRINQLTQEEKNDIARHVDQVIMYENAQAKKAKPPKDKPGLNLGDPKLLADKNAAKKAASEAAKAAKKAAAEAHKAAVKMADSILKAAKASSDGIKKNLNAAEDHLKKLRDEFNKIRDAIRDAFSVDLFETHSAKAFLKHATKNIKRNTQVIASESIIRGKLGNQAGASDFMRQLFESGNSKLINKLAKENSSTLAEVLRKFNESNDLATRIGTEVAKAFMVEGKPLETGILDVRDEVIRLRKELVMALAKVALAQKGRDKLKAAAGGIFSSATDLQVGEAGREVVVPLTRPDRALDLLLRSGALALPTVAAHIGSLESNADAQSLNALRGLGLHSTPSRRFAEPVVKVVKERTVNQEFKIYEAGDARLTAASVAARTAAHIDR